MFLAYLIAGVVAGAAAACFSFASGRSFGFSFLMYSVVGSAATLTLPLFHLAILEGIAIIRGRAAFGNDLRSDTDVALNNTSESSETSAPLAPGAIRILAVDDDPFILSLATVISSNAGFTDVTPVSSGLEALRLTASGRVPFDCFLLDISMPEMDGIELCKRIRADNRYRSTPIIMLTGMRDMKSMDQAFQAGATDYVTKPFDVIELGTRLKLVQEVAAKSLGQVEDVSSGPKSIAEMLTEQRFEQSIEDRKDGVKLGDQNALAKYLSSLTSTEAANARVAAVKIDRIDAIHSRINANQYQAVMDRVASALRDQICSDQLMLTYAGGGAFLIAGPASEQWEPETLELEVNRLLANSGPAAAATQHLLLTVSIGNPVRVRGDRDQRGITAFGKAIAWQTAAP